MRSRIGPMKKIARALRQHRELILSYFQAQKLISSGVVDGLNKGHHDESFLKPLPGAPNLTSMAKAIWEGVVLAESDHPVEVEGNQYFPPSSVRKEYLRPNDNHSVCPWKGTASYYDIVVQGKTNSGAAWYYPDPSKAARHIKDHVAFWRGVQIEK